MATYIVISSSSSLVNKTMIAAAQELTNRQSCFIANKSPDSHLNRLLSVNFVSDTIHSLAELDEFLKSMLDGL